MGWCIVYCDIVGVFVEFGVVYGGMFCGGLFVGVGFCVDFVVMLDC